MFSDAGKIILLAGLFMAIIGLLLIAFDKTGLWHWLNWFGHLPFDIRIEKENFRFYFPIGTSVLLSILLSLILYLINKFIR